MTIGRHPNYIPMPLLNRKVTHNRGHAPGPHANACACPLFRVHYQTGVKWLTELLVNVLG